MIMLVSTSGQVQPLAPLMLPQDPETSADQSGNISPARISPDYVSISDAGRERLAREMEHIAKAPPLFKAEALASYVAVAKAI